MKCTCTDPLPTCAFCGGTLVDTEALAQALIERDELGRNLADVEDALREVVAERDRLRAALEAGPWIWHDEPTEEP